MRSVRREHGSRVGDRVWGRGEILVFLVALSLADPLRHPASWAAEADFCHRLDQFGGAVMRAVFVSYDGHDADLSIGRHAAALVGLA